MTSNLPIGFRLQTSVRMRILLATAGIIASVLMPTFAQAQTTQRDATAHPVFSDLGDGVADFGIVNVFSSTYSADPKK